MSNESTVYYDYASRLTHKKVLEGDFSIIDQRRAIPEHQCEGQKHGGVAVWTFMLMRHRPRTKAELALTWTRKLRSRGRIDEPSHRGDDA